MFVRNVRSTCSSREIFVRLLVPLERSNQQSAYTWLLQIGLLPDGDMACPFPGSHQETFWIGQIRPSGKHEIDMRRMECDATH